MTPVLSPWPVLTEYEFAFFEKTNFEHSAVLFRQPGMVYAENPAMT